MSKPRSLWPREHGAYAQLAAPLIAALAGGAPGLAAALLVAGACLAFLAHEPLLVVLGHRGRRARDEAGGRARRRLAALVAGAAITGGAGLLLAPGAALGAAIVAPALVAVLALASRRAEHTAAGEVVAAAALAGAAVPVALASQWSLRGALIAWAAWTVGFAATVIAVHRVIARHRKAASATDVVAGGTLVAVTGAALVAAAHVPLAAAAAPLAGLSAALVVAPPRANRLRAVGVALTVAATIALAIVVAVQRGA